MITERRGSYQTDVGPLAEVRGGNLLASCHPDSGQGTERPNDRTTNRRHNHFPATAICIVRIIKLTLDIPARPSRVHSSDIDTRRLHTAGISGQRGSLAQDHTTRQ